MKDKINHRALDSHTYLLKTTYKHHSNVKQCLCWSSEFCELSVLESWMVRRET